MTLPKVVDVPNGARGFDTDSKINAETAKKFADDNFVFATRYITLGPTQSEADLDKAEIDAILGAGLGLMPVQHVRFPGWSPTEEMGVADGQNTRSHSHLLGIPAGVVSWLDLEGIDSRVRPIDVVKYCNAWHDEIHAWGYIPGLYVGSNSILSSYELYQHLKFKNYWKSLSTVPDVETRGYQMVQSAGGTVFGISIDLNVARADRLGNCAKMMKL